MSQTVLVYKKPKKRAREPSCWTGPFGIRVDGHVEVVCLPDGNKMAQDGARTAAKSNYTLNRRQYLARYGEKRKDGRWWYVGEKNEFLLIPCLPSTLDTTKHLIRPFPLHRGHFGVTR